MLTAALLPAESNAWASEFVQRFVEEFQDVPMIRNAVIGPKSPDCVGVFTDGSASFAHAIVKHLPHGHHVLDYSHRKVAIILFFSRLVARVRVFPVLMSVHFVAACVQRRIMLALSKSPPFQRLAPDKREAVLKELPDRLWAAASAPSKELFDKRMKGVQELSEVAFQRAMKIPPSMWAVHALKFPSFGRIDSNDAEGTYALWTKGKRLLAAPAIFRHVALTTINK